MSDQPLLSASVISQLESVVGPPHVLTAREDRICYAYDGQRVECLPDAIVRPGIASEICEVLRLANAEHVPVTPRGAGTGLSGGSLAASGGIVLDLTRMNRILEVDAGNMHATAEPGVITAVLAAEAHKHGLLYPPDPGSVKVSTIGGNVAENAGGLRACKYGVTRDYLMALKAVSPTGEEFSSGARTHKCVAGYDLVSLLCGSEGTLGVITEVTVRLIPIPRFSRAMTAVFPDAATAGGAVANVIGAGLVPATLEILDNFTLRTIEDHAHLGLPTDAGALVLAEFDGSAESAVTEEAETAMRVLCESGASSIEAATDARERDRVWEARRSALAALSRVKPTTILEDVTVPLPRLSEMIGRIEKIAAENGVLIGTFGHAGDGNLHPTVLTDERDEQEMARVEQAIERIFDAALEFGGTVSGEHGIGFAKMRYLEREVGPGTLDVMRRIKRALDPNNILNPGKFV